MNLAITSLLGSDTLEKSFAKQSLLNMLLEIASTSEVARATLALPTACRPSSRFEDLCKLLLISTSSNVSGS